MKSFTNILISHAIFLGIFAVAAIAFAQEDDTASSTLGERRAAAQEQIQERRAEVQENIEARRENFASSSAARQEVREERRSQLAERAQARVTNLAANMSNRMDAMIVRFENVIGRLESRIEKLNERGVDTSEAESALESAKLSVDAAAAEIATIDSDVADAVGSEDARAGWAAVKEKYQSIRAHLKTAHTELRNTVAALKAAVADAVDTNGVSDAVRSDNSLETNETEE